MIVENITERSKLREKVVGLRNWINNHAFIVTLFLFVAIKAAILILYMILVHYYLHTSVGDKYPRFHTGNELVDLLGTRWDSNLYLTIAYYGSYIDPLSPDDARLWVFAPGYPYAIRILVEMADVFQLEIPIATAGVIVSNLFSLTSTIAFFYTSRLYMDGEKAIGATLIFAFFPTTFVFGTVAYAEHVFLTFAILSWYFFEKEVYLLSGFALALATLARYPGSLMFFLYALIYFSRKVREKGLLQAFGCVLAIPIFPILVIVKSGARLISLIKMKLKLHDLATDLFRRFSLDQEWNEKLVKASDFLDIGLGSVLIWGLLPLSWLQLINASAPTSMSELSLLFWGAKFVFPFAGFGEMLGSGNVKWSIEKVTFVLLFIGIGLIVLARRPSFSLLIISQALFYSGYVGVSAWAVPRYIGSVFHGQLALAEDIQSNKIAFLILIVSLAYGFKVLWQFTHWDIWLI